jgi:hypothetical protein
MDKHGHPRFYQLQTEEADLHARKNSDYATDEEPLSNLKACERLIIVCPKCDHHFPMPAWLGVIVRLMDKWDRIVKLVPKVMSGKAPAVADESFVDTLKDNSVYSKLDIILLEEQDQQDQAVADCESFLSEKMQ